MSASAQPTLTQLASDFVGEGLYRVKRLRFPSELPAAAAAAAKSGPGPGAARTREWHVRPIVLQNENGPCPLIALCNVMLLCGDLNIHEDVAVVSFEQLTGMLRDYVLALKPPSGAAAADFAQNVEDALAILPRLATGLDVNVQFSGCDKFELTPGLLLFDLLDVPLLHGWLPDPADRAEYEAVSPLSYNSMVELIVSGAGDEPATGKQKESAATAASAVRACQRFLEVNPSQLTYHGLFELTRFMGEDQFAVLFRNNHFSTLYKFDSQLFVLCTDQGYLDLPVCWQRLAGVEGGDSEMCTDLFREYEPPSEAELQAAAVARAAVAGVPDAAASAAAPTDNLLAAQKALLQSDEARLAEERDAQLAAQLQAQERAEAESAAVRLRPASAVGAPNMRISDEDFARQLQLEEQQQLAPQQQQPQRATAPAAMKMSDEDLARQLQEEEFFEDEEQQEQHVPVPKQQQQQARRQQPQAKPPASKPKKGASGYGEQAKSLKEANAARRQRAAERGQAQSSSSSSTSPPAQRQHNEHNKKKSSDEKCIIS